MTDYIGVQCPVCEKKFTASDDIVVCPTCGAPHHRACYFEKGHCAFEEEHISGKVWQSPHKAQEKTADTKTCSGCNKASPVDNLFCNYCGRRFDGEPQQQGERPENIFGAMPWQELDQSFFIYGGLEETEVITNDITAKEFAAYVGPSSAYYLPRFKVLEKNTRAISINFSAMLFGFLFYFHRKMYLLGSILLLLFLAGTIPNILATRELFPQMVDTMGARESLEILGFFVGSAEDVNMKLVEHYDNIGRYVRMINFVIVAFTAFFANHFYYEKAKRSISQIRNARAENTLEEYDDYERALLKNGGCNKAIIIATILGINLLMGLIIINFMIAGG